jgi:hypothetical protein
MSVENDAPTGSGFRKSTKLLCTTADSSPAAGDQVYVNTILEGQDLQRVKKGTASAEQVTLSFWVKSNVTGTYVAWLFDDDNTRHVAATYSLSASATWERKTITFPADATGTFTNDNGASLYVRFWLGVGSSLSSGSLATTWASYTAANAAVGQTNLAAATDNYWQVTGVQLEVGPVATPFEFEPFEATLRKCQRYYHLHASGASKAICNGSYQNANSAFGVVHFPTSMRTEPTLSATSGSNYYRFDRNGGTDDFDSFIIYLPTEHSACIYNNGQTSGTSGQAGLLQTLNASASLAFSAELN